MTDLGFLGSLGSRVKNYLLGAVGDVREMGGRAREELFPPPQRMVSPLLPDMGRLVSPLPGGGQESDVLGSLRKDLGVKEDKGRVKYSGGVEKMGKMIISHPTPEGGKVTISVDVPTDQAPKSGQGQAPTGGLPSGFHPLTPPNLVPNISSAPLANLVDPAILSELLFRESSFRPGLVGGAGEEGMAQFKPSTREDLLKRKILEPFDPFNPEEAIRAAALYLAYLIEQAGDPLRGLAAYQSGLGNIEAGLPRAKEIMGAVKERR